MLTSLLSLSDPAGVGLATKRRQEAEKQQPTNTVLNSENITPKHCQKSITDHLQEKGNIECLFVIFIAVS